jgi:hypothetical protein
VAQTSGSTACVYDFECCKRVRVGLDMRDLVCPLSVRAACGLLVEKPDELEAVEEFDMFNENENEGEDAVEEYDMWDGNEAREEVGDVLWHAHSHTTWAVDFHQLQSLCSWGLAVHIYASSSLLH